MDDNIKECIKLGGGRSFRFSSKHSIGGFNRDEEKLLKAFEPKPGVPYITLEVVRGNFCSWDYTEGNKWLVMIDLQELLVTDEAMINYRGAKTDRVLKLYCMKLPKWVANKSMLGLFRKACLKKGYKFLNEQYIEHGDLTLSGIGTFRIEPSWGVWLRM